MSLQSEIELFVELVEGWRQSTLDCERADERLRRQGLTTVVLDQLADCGRDRASTADEIRGRGEQLAKQLVTAGHDAAGVLRVVHFTADVGSGARAFDWPAIKVALQQVALSNQQQTSRQSTDLAASQLEALMGDEDGEILRIARSANSASDRMAEIHRIDNRVLIWDSLRWADVLGTSDAAVRKSHWWRHERPAILQRQRDD